MSKDSNINSSSSDSPLEINLFSLDILVLFQCRDLAHVILAPSKSPLTSLFLYKTYPSYKPLLFCDAL